MHGHYLRQHWSEIRSQLQNKWDRLTDADLDRVANRWDDLLTILHERYGGRYENALGEITNFEDAIKEKIRNVNV